MCLLFCIHCHCYPLIGLSGGRPSTATSAFHIPASGISGVAAVCHYHCYRHSPIIFSKGVARGDRVSIATANTWQGN
uniref:Uncharacterized protein n=1 Tax=Amphimedon queenslandica TaxID=400682 RepID=A0A1X7UI65_AMPQE